MRAFEATMRKQQRAFEARQTAMMVKVQQTHRQEEAALLDQQAAALAKQQVCIFRDSTKYDALLFCVCDVAGERNCSSNGE